ncbi:MAG: hypothetical protein A4E61_01650 [Syntrophorhabdus sp. PtaB.Bin184]|jgi:hypothetical protein|nr:MAG: hypothetical protein A4E61_01650 [Syntrophorhabdus sp. PtaB.Bin184]
MAELSQSDLDALFADLELPGTEKPAPQADLAQAQTRQTDLDRLMADLEALHANTAPEPQETTPASPPSDSENLSQDQIDALLKEFLG